MLLLYFEYAGFFVCVRYTHLVGSFRPGWLAVIHTANRQHTLQPNIHNFWDPEVRFASQLFPNICVYRERVLLRTFINFPEIGCTSVCMRAGVCVCIAYQTPLGAVGWAVWWCGSLVRWPAVYVLCLSFVHPLEPKHDM